MTTPITIAFANLENAVREAAQALRKEFDSRDIGYLHLKIEVEGRTHGDLKVEYSVSDVSYGNSTKSHAPLNAMIEHFRRCDYAVFNTPKMIPYYAPEPEPTPVEDDLVEDECEPATDVLPEGELEPELTEEPGATPEYPSDEDELQSS